MSGARFRSSGRQAPAGPSVLCVDSNPGQRLRLTLQLQNLGYQVQPATSGAEALAALVASNTEIMLIDAEISDPTALDLTAEVLRLRPQTRVILLTEGPTTGIGIEAILKGAFHALVRPVDDTKLSATLAAALDQYQRLQGKDAAAGTSPAARPAESDLPFIGNSSGIQAVKRKILAIASSKASVFITGESGTGKELAAQAIHDNSNRAAGPFIALNCGAIPYELLESEVFGHLKGSFTGAIADKQGAAQAADGGTLFLDEICEMAPALQTKLLRFLQTSTVVPVGATKPREVNVRIICATNRDPEAAIRDGSFREDLFYRLYVVPLHMPPLRDRGSDILDLADTLLTRLAAQEGKAFAGFSPTVREALLAYPWPGNVRQLMNVLQNIAVIYPGGEVDMSMLPADLRGGRPQAPGRGAAGAEALSLSSLLGHSLAEIESRVIHATLDSVAGSIPKAARILDVSPSTLYRKLEGRKS